MNRKATNAAVIAAAVGAALLAVQQNTYLFADRDAIERERCYGVARAGANDCGNGKHPCARRSIHDREPDEWKMVPAGTCTRIGGSLRSSDEAQL